MLKFPPEQSLSSREYSQIPQKSHLKNRRYTMSGCAGGHHWASFAIIGHTVSKHLFVIYRTLKGHMNFYRHTTNEFCKRGTTICDLCGETFQKTFLIIHKQLTHDVDEQKCEHCGKIFQNQFRLKNHIKNQHGTPIPCNFCAKLFRTKEAIKLHILNKHTADEDKKFACEFCGKRYGVRKNLELHHQAMHSGGRKDFECQYCDYKTWSRANRDKHERTVHKSLEV